MKKKFREITVNGKRYAWCVWNIDDEGMPFPRVKIWSDKNTVLLDTAMLPGLVWPFHQNGSEMVTPRMIKEEILKLIA